jgi:hypothetical protein
MMTVAQLAKACADAYHVRVHTDQDLETLQERLTALQIEHRDLDAVIAHLSCAVAGDDLLLRRMKKRKLQLKDQMTLTERLLTPDEPA